MLGCSIHRDLHRVAATLAVLALAKLASGCVVSQRCFGSEDCADGQRCERQLGRCVASGPLLPDLAAGDAADGSAPLPMYCPLPAMVLVADTFCADIWEASRADADGDSPGADGSRATSRPGVIPWLVESNGEAAAACLAAGKRLCEPSEWQIACQGPEGTAYAYGETYEPKVCNGIDAFDDWTFHLAPTGSFIRCTNDWGIFDINGNVWEHTAGGDGSTVRGGAFNCADSRKLHRCDYVPGSWTPTALGFRCCANAVPQPPAPDAGLDGHVGDTRTASGPSAGAGVDG